MKLETVTGLDAIETALGLVETFFDDQKQRVYQVLGFWQTEFHHHPGGHRMDTRRQQPILQPKIP